MQGLRQRISPLPAAAAVVAVLALVLAATVIHPFGPAVTPPAGAPSSGRCPDQSADPSTVSIRGYRQAIACLVNHERLSRGLRSLHLDSHLGNAAYGHAADMRARDYFAHTSPNGSTVRSRAFHSRYLPGSGRWKVGEDLAWGTGSGATPRALVSAWMHSTAHRREILTRSYRDIGVGVARGSPRGPDYAGAMTVDASFGHR